MLGQNIVLNQTDVKETRFIISPKTKNLSGNPYEEQTLWQVAHRCVGQCYEEPEAPVLEDNRTRYWDRPVDWPSGNVPVAGEDVEIPLGMRMIFNMNPSPVYKQIRVNGNLTFDNTTDTHLRCHHLYIRAGELHIGSEDMPHETFARITLYGQKESETMTYDYTKEAGNKIIANVNVMKLYGKPRS